LARKVIGFHPNDPQQKDNPASAVAVLLSFPCPLSLRISFSRQYIATLFVVGHFYESEVTALSQQGRPESHFFFHIFFSVSAQDACQIETLQVALIVNVD